MSSDHFYEINAIHLITKEGFCIYTQSFDKHGQDQDIVASLIAALSSFNADTFDSLPPSWGDDKIMISESGSQITALLFLNKQPKVQLDEAKWRKKLKQFIQQFETIYAEELSAPLSRKTAFHVGHMIISRFLRNKMLSINQEFLQRDFWETFNELVSYPLLFYFEILPQRRKQYNLIKKNKRFNTLLGNHFSIEIWDRVVEEMIIYNFRVSFDYLMAQFNLEATGEKLLVKLLTILQFLIQYEIFNAYYLSPQKRPD